MLDGIINTIKPPGMTSHDVVKFLRHLLKIKRIGHTGTLDPQAAGILPICIGKGTRIVQFLVEKDKTYIAELTLGISTDTQDASGKTINVNSDFIISPQKLADTMSEFIGEIKQIPPMNSAVRVSGKRLYEFAREGKTIERSSRSAVIKELHVNKIWPEEPELKFGARVLFLIKCSKGTYIRTLCHDIGECLGTYAHMSFLSRTESGPFTMEHGYTLEEIDHLVKQNDYSFIKSIHHALPEWPRVVVAPLIENKVLHGNFIKSSDLIDVPKPLVVGEQVLLFNLENELLALAEIKKKGELICQPTRVLKEGK